MVVIVGVVVVVVVAVVVVVVGFYFSNSSKSNSKSSIFKPCRALAMPWKPLLLNALAGPCRALNHSPSNSLLCALSSFSLACALCGGTQCSSPAIRGRERPRRSCQHTHDGFESARGVGVLGRVCPLAAALLWMGGLVGYGWAMAGWLVGYGWVVWRAKGRLAADGWFGGRKGAGKRGRGRGWVLVWRGKKGRGRGGGSVSAPFPEPQNRTPARPLPPLCLSDLASLGLSGKSGTSDLASLGLDVSGCAAAAAAASLPPCCGACSELHAFACWCILKTPSSCRV